MKSWKYVKDIHRTKMKKELIVAAGMVIVAAAALCIQVSKESVVSNELFEENVEALTRVENDYQKKYG